MTIKYILLLYMPTIPLYNQGATEEAGLTRAKRRVIKAMKSGIAKLTEKPDVDPTDGNADVVASNLISQFEDLTALSRQITAYLGDGEEKVELDNPDEAVKTLRLVIMAAKAVARILRTVKALAPKMRYLDLGILSDLKAVEDECTKAFFAAVRAMRSLDFAKLERVIDDIGNYEDPELERLVTDWDGESTGSFFSEEGLSEDTGSMYGETRGQQRGRRADAESIDTGSTQDKTVNSGSTRTKRTPVGQKQARVNSMFGFLLGAAEDLRNAVRPVRVAPAPPRRPRAGSPRRFPPPVPRGVRVDPDVQRAIERGAMMAQLDEEEQLRQEGLAKLRADVDKDKAQLEADDYLVEQLNKVGTQAEKPFKRFGVGAYENLVDLLTDRYKSAIEILYAAYDNFNAYRQQKVTRNEADVVDVGNAIKTGAGFEDMVQGSNARLMGGNRVFYPGQVYTMEVRPGDRRATAEEIASRQKIYRVGGSSDILYRREGLPRFL